MKPSRLSTSATSRRMREAGMLTSERRTCSALRTRVSRSAMGSVIIFGASSPARLAHAGDFPGQRERAEADAADAELAQVRMTASAQVAARFPPSAELRRHLGLGDPAGLAHE